MQVIALTGQARAGKTHIVHLLAQQAFAAGQVPVLVSFAGALKAASADAGFPKDTHPKEYRAFCQTEGAARRDENPDYWINITLKEIAQIVKQEQEAIARGDKYWERVILIDDVRFQNEVTVVAKMDGILLHVYAGGRLPVPHARFRRHPSEKLSKQIDRTENNIAKLSKIFYDRDGSECSVFWIDNSGSTKSVEAMMLEYGAYFIGTHIAQTESSKAEFDATKNKDTKSSGVKDAKYPGQEKLSDKDMADFVDELNKMFDKLDQDDVAPDDLNDGWEELDDEDFDE